MLKPNTVELAETAYAAYGAATGHRTYDDRPMPAWEDLGARVQAAWVCAAGAVALDTLARVGASNSGCAPDVGDVVLVPMDPVLNNGAAVAPALVTRVWNPTTVNVRILADSEAIEWRTSVVYRDSLDDVAVPAAVWTWPGGQ
ncbi:hypothetical protein [Streptomyces sp. NPDC050988]|uniref:hypothetical protein n=1 Tax=Streptomyces sp. NPDC050988 TaxID=3365637 RepID=UPI0037999BA3